MSGVTLKGVARVSAIAVACSAALLACSNDNPASPGASDHPPVITAPANVSGTERTAIAFDVSATDPDGDAIATLTADLTKLPVGNTATFTKTPDLTLGRVAWTPTFFDSGAYNVVFAASNSLQSARVTTNIQVANAIDRPPVVTGPASVSAITGEDVTIAYAVADPDGDPVTSVEVAGASSGYSFGGLPFGVQTQWTACKEGDFYATILATSGTPPITGSMTTTINVTGVADRYVDITGGAQTFQPDTITVSNGATIAWRNLDTISHAIKVPDYFEFRPWIRAGCESKAGYFQPYAPYMNLPRIYSYYCSEHPDEKGVVISQP